MEGAIQVTFSSKGRLRMKLSTPAEKTVDVPATGTWWVRLKDSQPARLHALVQLAELPYSDKAGLAAAITEWTQAGLKVRSEVRGTVFGISGKVIDTRRYALMLDEPARAPEEAAARQTQLLRQWGLRTTLFEIIDSPAKGVLELWSPEGSVLATSQDRLTVESAETQEVPIDVARVEYGVGYDFHNFEDRSYRGALLITIDKRGKLAVVNQVALEDLLKGLVPSEIFGKAHPEALKAQAVTARGEVLAKIGLKHFSDPYLLCSEQHCAVYKGVSGELPTTNAAVTATRGEGLFDAEGRLVDSVYSAVCGGHTENNEVAWGGTPNPSLRGKPDLLPGKNSTVTPEKLGAFLTTEGAYACRLSSFSSPSKFRWEKRFSAAEVNAKTAALNLGTIYAMTVIDRGVSGRARLLNLSGETGATQIRGELNIRKLFGMLNSAMFEVRAEKDGKGKPTAWVFTGGGWGHGVGMCQIGAIGRAEAGQNYRQILEHYYSGAQVARIY
ncbi:MAG: SpoIID/LytB domain-containing protein [Myxococcaceae bacterium]|nr:SpoIID/LytB domain-containing protein [Myxococcaceae bacterium]